EIPPLLRAPLFPYTTLFRSGSAAANFAFTLAGCNLNHLPAGRLDANAIKLLNLYPNPTDNAVTSLFSNFADSPALREDRNAFDRSEEHTSELQSLRHLVCRL